uniref:Gastrula zinc finger protein XlCGF57.1 n=1 Tax=Cacopsylla melanoneura TaxID=428564 RepID=A0A8D8UJ79_9HEMI
MDYSGTVDYDVNTPFKYEGDEAETVPQSDEGGVDDPSRVPVHHHQDDLIYPPLDFATPTPQAMDNPHSVPSSNTHLLDSQHTQSLGDSGTSLITSTNSHHLSNNISRSGNTVGDTTTLTMETESIVHETENQPPSSPESEDMPLARRTAPARRGRGRPARSTRTNKSFAEADDEEEEEFDQKPPKGLFVLDSTPSPPLLGTQSIFSSLVQKERRTQLTKGAKKKKKTEPEFCRFCFTNELSLQKVRTVKLPSTSSHPPNTKFTSLVPSVIESVQLGLNDKWTNPSFGLVCDECVQVFSSFAEFRTNVETNDALLRKLYCKSKAKSKKPPPSAPVTPTPTPPPSSGKGGKRGKAKPDPSSADDSEAVSTVSTKQKKPGRRGRPPKASAVTDDDDYETDGYLSSVSKTSRKSTTSRKGSKKKRGVTTDDDTDGYLSSVSRKSTTVTNTSAAAKNAKKKKRYNSDSDNEDVKSDVSDGMDFGGPTPYDTGTLGSKVTAGNSHQRRTRRTSGVKSESDLDDETDYNVAEDSYNDDSDLDKNFVPSGYESRRNNTSLTEDEDSKLESETRRGRPRKSKDTPPAKRSASVAKNMGDLPKIVGKNLGLFTNSGKMASNYFDIVFKNRNTPTSNETAVTNVKPEVVKVKEEKMMDESDEDKPYMSNEDDRFSPDIMSDTNSGYETGGGKRKRKRGRPKVGETIKKTKKDKRKKKEKKDEKRARLREELKAKMAEAPDRAVEFDGDLENLKFEADEFFDGEVPLYESSTDKEENEEDEEMEEEVWQCRHCPMKHRSHDLLLRHYTKQHGGYDWASVCYYCGYFNGHKKMIYLHIKDHYAPKKREMKICDICCAEVLHLQQHQKAAHSGVCYDCTFCGKGFTRKAELNIHIKAVHLKHQLEQRFVCQYCNKDFPFMKYLKRHLRVHSNDVQVPNPYKCTACNAAFNTKSALNVHRKTCPNLELLNRDLLPNQTGTVTPEPPPQQPQQMPPPPQTQQVNQQQRNRTQRTQQTQQAPPTPLTQPLPHQPPPQQEDPQLLLQNFMPPNSAAAARDLISATNLREIQIGLSLPPNARELQIANTARELQLASTARELQLTNLTARDLQNLQNSKFERPQMYYY